MKDKPNFRGLQKHCPSLIWHLGGRVIYLSILLYHNQWQPLRTTKVNTTINTDNLMKVFYFPKLLIAEFTVLKANNKSHLNKLKVAKKRHFERLSSGFMWLRSLTFTVRVSPPYHQTKAVSHL